MSGGEDDNSPAAGGYITVTDAARLRGLLKAKEIRVFREDLLRRHRQSRDVLYRRSQAPNAPYWTTWRVLRREYPREFGEDVEASALEVMELRGEVVELRRRVGRLELAMRARPRG